MALVGILVWVAMAASVVGGILLIVRGLRGAIDVSEPHCRVCRYELRAVLIADRDRCPECGADLGARRAVSFGRARRRPLALVGGLALLVLPAVTIVGVNVFVRQSVRSAPVASRAVATGPDAYGAMTSAELIATARSVPDGPWFWDEIAGRLDAGDLTVQAQGELMDAVAAGLAANPEMGQALRAWGGDVLRSMMDDETLPRASRTALGAAMTPAPSLKATPRSRVGKTRSIRIDVDQSVARRTGTMLVAVHDVRIVGDGVDRPLRAIGRRAAPSPPYAFLAVEASRVGFGIPDDVPPGTYEVRADIEWRAMFDEEPLLDDDRRPRHPEHWPDALVRRRTTLTAPVELIGPDEPLVAFLPEAESDAAAAVIREAIGRVGLRARPAPGGKVRLDLMAASAGSPRRNSGFGFGGAGGGANMHVSSDVPYCYQIVVIVGDTEVYLGKMAGGTGGTSSTGGGRVIDGLPDGPTTAVVEYRPAPDEADQMLPADDSGTLPAIIGTTIRFEDVEIDRR